MDAVDLNKLISYDLQIVFDPLKLALAGKADLNALTALAAEVGALRSEQASTAAQLAMLKELLQQGGSTPNVDMSGALDIAGRFAGFEAEIRSRVDALEKKEAPDFDALMARLAQLEARRNSTPSSSNQNVEELVERVGSLETEVSRILSQLSSTLSSTQFGTHPPQSSSTASAPSAAAAAPASAPASAAPAAVQAAAAVSVHEATSATTPASTSASSAAVNAVPAASAAAPTSAESSERLPSSSAASASKAADPSTAAATAATVELPTSPLAHSSSAARPSSAVSGSGKLARPGSGAFRRDGTEIPDWGSEIRSLGDRLQALVAQLVPTNETANSARSAAEAALLQARNAEAALASINAGFDRKIADLEARLLASMSGLKPTADNSAAVDSAALRAEIASLRERVDALLAAPRETVVVEAPAPAPALAPVEGEDPAVAALRAELNAVSARVSQVTKKQADDTSSLRATDTDVNTRLKDLAGALDALKRDVAAQARAPAPAAAPVIVSDNAGISAELTKLAMRATKSEGDIDGLLKDNARLADLIAQLESSLKAAHAAQPSASSGVDSAQYNAWIFAATAALQSLYGADASGADGASESLASVTAKMRELAAAGKIAATQFEVRGVQTSVRGHDSRIAELEGRLKTLADMAAEALSNSKASSGGVSAADLDALKQTIAELQESKVDKTDLHERLGSLQAALAAVTKRVNEWIRKLSEALAKQGLSASPTKEGTDRAAGTHKQLLKGFNCLSCDQPLRGLPTDRGDAVPQPAMTQSSSTSKAFLYSHGPATHQQMDATMAATTTEHFAATAASSSSGTGAGFMALSNGHVIQRPATAARKSKAAPHSPPGPGTGLFPRLPTADGTRTIEQGQSVKVVNRRGSGVFLGPGLASATPVASTVVGSATESPLPHIYLDKTMS
jgi:hypothetical protein